MEEIKLNIYNDDFTEVIETVKAEFIEIPFGVIRKLMKLFKVDKIDDINQILEVVLNSWDDLIKLLDKIFPGLEDDDWDHVSTKELVQTLYKIIKQSAKELANIPVDQKN